VQCIEWPLKYPDAYAALGLRLPRGVLLHGPPGCAKTSLVRAAAASCHVNFLAISGAQLYSPYLGEAEKTIAEVCCAVNCFKLIRTHLIVFVLISYIKALVHHYISPIWAANWKNSSHENRNYWYQCSSG